MPRAPADAKKPKRDPRLRPLHPPADPWAWIVDEPVRKPRVSFEHNIHDLQTKPSFYVMVKRALLANKMHYLRGVSMNSIYNYVAANWPVDLDTFRRLTRVAVKRALEEGKLEIVPGVGVNYRLSPAERPNGSQKREDEEEPAPKKRGAAKGGVVASKRGRVGGGKNAKQDESDEDSYEAPRKQSKKVSKKAGNDRLTNGNHMERQKGEGKWIWQFLDGNWRDYDANASDEVEMTYQLYEKEKATGRIIDVRSVRSGTWEYQVDFRQFTQQNVKHESHTIRPIRRVWRSF